MFDWEKFAKGKIAVYCENAEILGRFFLMMEDRGLHHYEKAKLEILADKGSSISIRGMQGYLPDVKFGMYSKHASVFGLEDEVNAVDVIDAEFEPYSAFDATGFLDLIGIG